ncbi:site-specific integrase [Paraburkholderia sp. RL18-085-BIA-A]|uniref:hypothetical protein n=1 Tax=Paraburkholderia sp. RL18-085-BIA-A TaxID=3031633 RepID=UPI0038B80F33
MRDSVDVSTPIGLCDRALIALMVFSFARIGAALAIRIDDVYRQYQRLSVRLREKDGKRHEMHYHHTLKADSVPAAYLDSSDDCARYRAVQQDATAAGRRVRDGAAPCTGCR